MLLRLPPEVAECYSFAKWSLGVVWAFSSKSLAHRARMHLFNWRCWQRRLLGSLGTKHWTRDKGCNLGHLGNTSFLILGWVVPTGCFCVLSCEVQKDWVWGFFFFYLSSAETFTLFAIHAVIQHLSQSCTFGTECHNKAHMPKILPWNRRRYWLGSRSPSLCIV